jgi:hypothetical protein
MKIPRAARWIVSALLGSGCADAPVAASDGSASSDTIALEDIAPSTMDGRVDAAMDGATNPPPDGAADATAEGAMDASPDGATEDAGECPRCTGPGQRCLEGVCVDNCRVNSSVPCGPGTACDFTDGQCRAPTAPCFIPGRFTLCPGPTTPEGACGPGTVCVGEGICAPYGSARSVECDRLGRCWATTVPCARPAPSCMPAPLDRLNRMDFVGAPNGRDEEGAFDLEFDEQCTAYAVTMLSGTDYLRQLTADGAFRQWASVGNLNMGEVARLPESQGGTSGALAEIAATYICCAACGCTETGTDGRLGVVRLDRASMTRPLPNVIAARSTTGTGPFGNANLDTGPYGLVWGSDDSLYVGNVNSNGEFVRADLRAGTSTRVAMFSARVVAAANFDPRTLLVALSTGEVRTFDLLTRADGPWAMLPGPATSLTRDAHTGRVYAEVNVRPPAIFELTGDGASRREFARPRALGRVAIAPDGFLYHLNVFPDSGWRTSTAIQRWPLPATR